MTYWRTFWQAMVPNNPVFVLALGLCSTLAVTNNLRNASFMGIMVGLAALSSALIISALRYYIPYKYRLIAYMMVISTVVIFIELSLKLLFPDIADALGPYVGLIVTNCIVMGRLEAFSSKNPVDIVFFDTLGMSVGYYLVLISMGSIREAIGAGKLLGIPVMPDWFTPIQIMNSAPGAFLVFAGMIFCINFIKGLVKREK